MSTNERIGGMLIFAVTLLVTFVALFSLIPTEMFANKTENYGEYSQRYTTPTSWEGIELFEYAFHANGTLNDDYVDWSWLHLDLKDDSGNIKNSVIASWTSTHHYLYLDHYFTTWWGLLWNQHFIAGYDNVTGSYSHYPLTYDDITRAWNAKTNSSYIKGRCDHGLIFHCYFTFNQTRYSDFETAWNSFDILIFVGQGYADTLVKMDAWSIIGLLLTFQAPQVFGATGVYAVTLNLIIALPIWTCIAYVFYRLILMAVPFVGG